MSFDSWDWTLGSRKQKQAKSLCRFCGLPIWIIFKLEICAQFDPFRVPMINQRRALNEQKTEQAGNKWNIIINKQLTRFSIHHLPSLQSPLLKQKNKKKVQRKKCVGIKCTSRQARQKKERFPRGKAITNNCCWCCWTYHIKLFYCCSPGSTFLSLCCFLPQHHLWQGTFLMLLTFISDRNFSCYAFFLCASQWWWKLISLREQFMSCWRKTMKRGRQKTNWFATMNNECKKLFSSTATMCILNYHPEFCWTSRSHEK